MDFLLSEGRHFRFYTGQSEWKRAIFTVRGKQFNFALFLSNATTTAARLGLTRSQIVDFAIWLIFSNAAAPSGKVKHLLCQGFRKDVTSRSVHRGENVMSAIPGITSTYPNSHVTSMKTSPWPEILALMGKQGEKVMVDLILDCGTFLSVASCQGELSSVEW